MGRKTRKKENFALNKYMASEEEQGEALERFNSFFGLAVNLFDDDDDEEDDDEFDF